LGCQSSKNASESERKIAEEVAEWIDDIKDFEMFLFDAMDGVGHGYSCQEIEWHQLGNLWLPKSFEHINPRNFMTPYDQPNELRLNDGSMTGADFWDYGWFVHRHKAKSGYIARSGLHRVLSWSFLFKNYGIRDVMEFLETYGLPSKIGKYPRVQQKKKNDFAACCDEYWAQCWRHYSTWHGN
jgi:phage gp29-like protein